MSVPKLPKNNEKLRLVCFDGGGVRGLASLYILQQILGSVGNPLPCQYFDMMGGTSTGALIAIMLGILEMDIQTCIDKYIDIMTEVFTEARTFPIDRRGNIAAKYRQEILRQQVLAVIGDSRVIGENNPEDLRMRGQDRMTSCRVFVVATHKDSGDRAIFSNYPRPLEQQSQWVDQVTVCEAALASTAALSFFDPMRISHSGIRHIFLDGAFIANNPVNILWNEAQKQFVAGTPLSDRIRILLSIGTGKMSPDTAAISIRVTQILEVLKRLATETDGTAKTFHETNMDLALKRAYMRFNPPYMDDIGLDDALKKNLISSRSMTYGDDMDQIQRLYDFQRVAGTEKSRSFIEYTADVEEQQSFA